VERQDWAIDMDFLAAMEGSVNKHIASGGRISKMEAEIKAQIPGIDSVISEYSAVGKNVTYCVQVLTQYRDI
jgi:hypothetical protein